MKHVFYTIISILCLQPVFAGVLTVSNATVSPGQYSSISAAISAAAAGDTLLIHGTGISYGGFTLNKSLVLIGPGHNPTDKQNSNAVIIDNINMTAGSSQSKFYGLNINQISTGNTSIVDVVVSNCLIRNQIIFTNSNSNNWVVDGCIFTSTGYNVNGAGTAASNLRVRNCVLNGVFYNFPTSSGYNYITNSVFLGGTNENTFQFVNAFFITNSIFYRAIPRQSNSWVVFDRCVSYNTIGGNNAFSPNANGVARTVYEGVNPDFEDFPAAGALFNYAHNFRLKQTSPVKNSGTDATDVGVYGGTEFSNVIYGYNQNGIPLNPYIKSFTITGNSTVNAGDNLQIAVEAKVRN